MMRRRAFTFIEIMLTVAAFAALSTAVFTCLASGLRLWERGKALAVDEDVTIFFDRFSSDLRNAFSFSTIDFHGEESRLHFPTLVWTPADRVSVRADEGMVDQIGAVEYSFDPGRGVLVRRQADYALAVKGAWGPEMTVVERVTALRLHYFYGTSPDPQMSAEALPSGVEVELVISDGKFEKTFRRYVILPAGG
jgi:hypothetical protein